MADRTVTTTFTAVLVLLAVTALVPAGERPHTPAAASTAYTPSESFVHFFRAINQDRLHDAEGMMAHFPGMRREHGRREVQRIAEAMAGGYRPALVASMQLGQCAVVVFDDPSPRRGAVDLDPAYFLYRNGRWMVMPEVTRIAGQWQDLTTAQADDFKALEQWFKDSKRALTTIVDDSRTRQQKRVRTRH